MNSYSFDRCYRSYHSAKSQYFRYLILPKVVTDKKSVGWSLNRGQVLIHHNFGTFSDTNDYCCARALETQNKLESKIWKIEFGIVDKNADEHQSKNVVEGQKSFQLVLSPHFIQVLSFYFTYINFFEKRNSNSR